MNSNSTVAEVALRREKSGLGGMIKALAWEECRVAGVIAGWCVIVGALCLGFCWTQMGGAAWHMYREITLLFVVGAPMLTALLLILSTDYSGHLVGGFSERILHLPVPVTAAVAVALLARTIFVFVSALVFVTACHALFGEGPGIGAVPGITLFYLFAQTIDWLRKPLSGLSSILIVASSLACIQLLGRGGDIAEATLGLVMGAAGPTALLCLALAPAYGIAVAAVHAARVGRRIGIPELWEWPRYVSVPWPVRSRPFATPLAAQVWFDLRRSWWILPGVTVLVCLVVGAIVWLSIDPQDFYGQRAKRGFEGFFSPNEPSYFKLYYAVVFAAFAGVVLGAVMHSGQTGLLFRRNAKPLPQLLHPMTSAQFAFARIVTSATILVPMIATVLVLHFALTGEYFLSNIIPDALAIGATSYREVFWVLLSRGLLVGLIAWPLMNGGNRTIAGLFTLECVLAVSLYSGPWNWEDTRNLLPVVAIVVAVVVYARAWRTGVVSVRSVLVAAGVWALATWVLYRAVHTAMPFSGALNRWYAESLITCLGWAALIPLPFAAVALDVRWRRHSAAAPQDPSQHINVRATLFTGSSRTIALVAIAFVVVTFVWLGWPMRPAYESYWRAHGYPVTLDELDAWYPAVPDDQNRALAYLEVAEERNILASQFWSKFRRQRGNTYPDQDDRLLIVGGGEYVRGEPLVTPTWDESQAYWHEVTSRVAPDLKRLTENKSTGSRYPVDLRNGFAAELPQLAKVRELGRELSLDSLHWTVAGEPSEAVDSIAALIPLANSTAEEPLLISQLVRIAVFGIAYDATEAALNLSVMPEDALAELKETLANAMPPPDQKMMLARAMVGEATIGLQSVASPDLLAGTAINNNRFLSGSTVLFWQLAGPAEAERMAILRYYDRLFEVSNHPRQGYANWIDAGTDWLQEESAFFAPMAAILAPGLGRAYDAEWRIRTQFDIARAAIAVERYRLANSRLPDTLQQLVPAYLSEVSMDYFANFEAPLGYRQLGDESYVVYSIGMDMEDDQGVEMDDWWSEGDITFTVAPLSVRTGPQVAAE